MLKRTAYVRVALVFYFGTSMSLISEGKMISDIQSRVGDISAKFTHNTQIEISEQTKDLVAQIISAIMEDPHDSWNISPDSRELFVGAYLSALPLFFYQVMKTENVEGRITSFDFLHWFSRQFEANMCVITKQKP